MTNARGIAEDDNAGLLRHALACARAKSADVAAHVHPAWIETAWQRIGIAPPPSPDAAGVARCAIAFASLYGLRWPSLARFERRAHRIALLPRTEILRVLAAVALHDDRERVRRCVERGLRSAIVRLVGEAAYQGLIDAPRRPAWAPTALAAADLDPPRLAAAGYAVLSAQGAWQCRDMLAWVRLALPPAGTDAEAPAWPVLPEPAPVLDRLSTYFPEHAWLFGSPMDRALSAWTTA
jgi:hypothetical protein